MSAVVVEPCNFACGFICCSLTAVWCFCVAFALPVVYCSNYWYDVSLLV